MIYLFVLDDLLASQRFTTRTEQPTKCCEPLQKMRVRLGACKIDLSPPPPSNFMSLIIPLMSLIVPLRYFCRGFICLFVFLFVLDSIFVLFEPYVRFHIFIFFRVIEWPPIGKYLLTWLTICFF